MSSVGVQDFHSAEGQETFLYHCKFTWLQCCNTKTQTTQLLLSVIVNDYRRLFLLKMRRQSGLVRISLSFRLVLFFLQVHCLVSFLKKRIHRCSVRWVNTYAKTVMDGNIIG